MWKRARRRHGAGESCEVVGRGRIETERVWGGGEAGKGRDIAGSEGEKCVGGGEIERGQDEVEV